MSRLTLEQRVKSLESQLARVQDELRVVKFQNGKDWRRTIGAFTGDEGMQELFREAMRLREADRGKVRARKISNAGKRK
jgi:hypothetical protein